MQRLHQAIGKPNKQALGFIAQAVEWNPWMMSRLQEYVSKAPMMKSRGPEVIEAEMDMAVAVGNVDKISELLQKLPALQQGLRNGATDACLALLRQKIDDFVKLGKSSPEPILLKKLGTMLFDASLVWPIDPALPSYSAEIGALLKDHDECQLLDTLQQKCEVLARVEVDDFQKFQAPLEDLLSHITSVGVGTGKVQDKHKVAMHKAIKCIWSFAACHDLKKDQMIAMMNKAANVGAKLASFLKDQHITEENAMMSQALDMSEAMSKLKSLLTMCCLQLWLCREV